MASIKKDELKEIFSVLSLYGIDLTDIKIVRDTVGFVNKIYFVTIGKKKLVLRKSNPATSLAHIKLEVKLLEYLSDHHFAATPQIIRNLKGTDITIYNKSFFTLQTFMPGSIKASWNKPDGLTAKRAQAFFQTIAKFNKAVEKFPSYNNIANQSLGYFVKNGSNILAKKFRKLSPSIGKNLVLKYRLEILEFIKKTDREFVKTGYDALPKQLIHCDLHPGNVNFLNDKVVAIFDFDWARYDCRFSDLASALSQTNYYFGGKKDGIFKKEKLQSALSNYRRAYGKSNFSVFQENEYIKAALRAYIIYTFFWAIDLYEQNKNKENFLSLNHFLNVMLVNDFDCLFD